MDDRLVDETERYMAGRGVSDKYDHTVLAGASLGAVTTKYPDWGRTFWAHLDVAIQLHHVKKVIVLHHRDCGAYKTLLGEDLAPNRGSETEVHATPLRALRVGIKKRHPDLEVQLLLITRGWLIETIA